MLRALYTYALWVYVDETKIKKRSKFYYLWNAKHETIWSWLASFIALYTLLEVKS